MQIKFGTSGWRAIIADEFTFANLRKVTSAIAKYIKSEHLQHKGIIVGYDTRFLSKEFAHAAAATLAEYNIKVFLTSRDTPTPAIADQILAKKTAGGINITASHNPPEYSGIKFSPAYGGPASIDVTSQIERNIQSQNLPAAKLKARINLFDPRPGYLKRLKKIVNLAAIRRARLKIGLDFLYGTGRGYLDQVLRSAGCRLELLHDYLDPSFGGFSPEPESRQLQELIQLVRKKRLHLGLALDGDADRFGIVDRDGSYISANQALSLLTYHLINTRPRQKTVARTLATTHMMDALAQKYGYQLVETFVGFKYIGQEIARGDCLIGGEESGGLSIAGHIPEKDGILACLLIAELIAIEKKSLGQLLKQLYREVGPHFSARSDIRITEKEKLSFTNRIKALAQGQTLLGRRLSSFNGSDGHKFIFTDRSWLMFRVSGTEPVIRCYCEASSKPKLQDLLRLGQKLVKK
ncbi:phosphoglucomutase/phosphomannomutase family protein [Candidatus Omnitrophota bacterium]